MTRLKSILMTALLAVAGTAVAVAIAPGAAHAANGPCKWTSFGNASNCDGNAPVFSKYPQCYDDARVAGNTLSQQRNLYTKMLDSNVFIQLMYSPSCATAWAEMSSYNSLPSGSVCYVKVQRNSDGERFAANYLEPDVAVTAQVYDQDVTAYAWGYCRYPSGRVVTAATASW